MTRNMNLQTTMKDDKRFSESSKKKSPSREDLEENEGIKSNR